MSQWFGFVARTVIVCVVLVGVAGGAAVAGVAAISAIFGLAPVAVVETALNKLQAQVGIGNDELTRVTKNVVSLRGEFSQAFGKLEARVHKIEQSLGDYPAQITPQKTGGFIKTQLATPPMMEAPRTKFGGAITEDMLDREPKASPPDFSYTAPKTADVCMSGCRFQTLNAAYNAAKDGGSITVAPGLYPECLLVKKSILIVGQKGPDGARAEFNTACRGKGAFVVQAKQFELRGVMIRDIAVRDRNGACLRIDPITSKVRVSDIICSNSETGILGSAKEAIFIDSSLFIGNGFGGRAHGVYVHLTPELIVRNTIIHSSKGAGHTLKSGAARTIIQNSILAALDSENSRTIDFYGGGTLVVTCSVLQQGPNSQNHDMINFASEANRINISAEHIALFEDNWIIFDYKNNRCCRWLVAGTKLGPIIFRNNRLVGINSHNMSGLQMEGNREFKDRAEAGLPKYTGMLASLPLPKAWQ